MSPALTGLFLITGPPRSPYWLVFLPVLQGQLIWVLGRKSQDGVFYLHTVLALLNHRTAMFECSYSLWLIQGAETDQVRDHPQMDEPANSTEWKQLTYKLKMHWYCVHSKETSEFKAKFRPILIFFVRCMARVAQGESSNLHPAHGWCLISGLSACVLSE